MERNTLAENWMPWGNGLQKLWMKNLVQTTLAQLNSQISSLRDGCKGPEQRNISVRGNTASGNSIKGSWLEPKNVGATPRWTEVGFSVDNGNIEIRVLRGLYGDRKFLYIISTPHLEAATDLPEAEFNWPAALQARCDLKTASEGTYGFFEFVDDAWTSEYRWNINWSHELLCLIR
jgi:hypothetical protein